MSERLWKRARPLLKPFVPSYYFCVSARNALYNLNLKKSRSLPIPVVSVGNLTMGGTGKTPLTLALARKLQSSPFKKKPAILLRGYRRRSSGFRLVSDGKRLLCDVRTSGDEAQLYGSKLTGVPVAVDENRRRGGEALIAQFHPSVILLDDGFQHRRLQRDLDIVLVDAATPLNKLTLLPAGPLREPVSSLRRADLIILTDFNGNNALCQSNFEAAVSANGADKVLTCRTKISGCRSLATEKKTSLKSLRGKKLIPFCGLANPQKFSATLAKLNANIPYLIRFPDHHFYQTRDVERLAMTFNAARADYLITTAKDAVKLQGLFAALPILVLDIEIEWLSGQETLDTMLFNLFN